MRCRVCNVADGMMIQRAADGSTRWRQVRDTVFGDKQWFSSAVARVAFGLCNGFVCRARVKEEEKQAKVR